MFSKGKNVQAKTVNMTLFKDDYEPKAKIYTIEQPEIKSGSEYFFETESGMEYEVRFGRKKDNYMGHIINFSVLNDEFEDEYSETNKGEIYKVIATVIEIIRMFHENHEYSNAYEFTGEFKDGREDNEVSIRTKLYHRYAKQVLNLNEWDIELVGNKGIIKKK